MTLKETKILDELIERASDEMSNHGCNDFDLGEYLTKREINDLVKDYHKWNGDPEEYDAKLDNRYALPDWALLKFLYQRLKQK